MLISAVWIGLTFANQLVGPIRRLIRATDEVASGNLYVQVPTRRSEGDLGHLGETFNKMTLELRQQRNRLIAANAAQRRAPRLHRGGAVRRSGRRHRRRRATASSPSATPPRRSCSRGATRAERWSGRRIDERLPAARRRSSPRRARRELRLHQGAGDLASATAASACSTCASPAIRSAPIRAASSRSTTSPISSPRSAPPPGPTSRAASPTKSRIR